MDARQCLEFLVWFETLPALKSAFRDNSSSFELASTSDGPGLDLPMCLSLRLVERFDWLSDELLGLRSDFEELQRQARESERSEILRVATNKRAKEATNRSRLFLTKRAQWEHDTRVSQLERMTQNLEDEKSDRILLQERAKIRRLEFIETVNKLAFSNALKCSESGVFRVTRTGNLVAKRLQALGPKRCQGWSLQDILTVGHLLAK